MANSDQIEKAKGANDQQSIKLYTGATMPFLGLGTWKSQPGDVTKAVEYALDVGYRHIDCAYAYSNEKEVGQAFSKKLDKVIKRKDLFVTSKLWNTFHHPEDVIPKLKETLNNLQLEYLDLFLIHWPMSFKRGKELFPRKENGKMEYGEIIKIEDTWKAMEEAVEKGLTKHIGLSNFNHKQIEAILKVCKIKPAVNQCESHPYLTQDKLINYCQKNNIVFTAFSPLGSSDRPWKEPNDPSIFTDETLKTIANNKNKSVAQIVLKYQIQRNVVVIPKSVTPKNIKSNLELWDFNLTDQEMKTISSLNCNWRACVPKIKLPDGTGAVRDSDHPYFPFHEEY